MKIEVYNPEDAAKIKAYFQETLSGAGIKSRSGRLYNPEITWNPSEDGGTWTIDFEQYGLYLDKGVLGVKGGRATGSPFKMGNKGIFKALSGKMTGRQIGAIYWWGVKPYPWQETFLNGIEEALTKGIEDNLVQEINTTIEDLPNTQIKITL